MNKETLLWRYAQAQQRHAKRMYKIMELLTEANAPKDYEILSLLAKEEHEKRKEDREALWQSPAKGLREQCMEVLTYEITDPTVAFFLEQRVDKLRQLNDTRATPEPEEEPE